MIRRLFIVAVSLAALTACTTYDSGYRNYSPAQAGYGDYYYAPDPGPSYYSPGYVSYPAYYSLYWGFDRHYYSSWRRPHFSYGVTWFPNDWFGFSAVHRYPSYSYWHPYAPYRYSAWDHRFAWQHYSPPPRHRYRPSPPRYGHPSNERHMQREQLVGGPRWGDVPNASGPRGRGALEATAPQRVGSAPQRTAYREDAARTPSTRGAQQTSEARMRQQAFEVREARLRDQAARARPVGAPADATRQTAQRPWQQAQPAPRARAGLAPETAPPRNIPDRRESQGPRQVMGDPRRAPMRETIDPRQAPRIGDAPRARPMAPVAAPQQRRMPVQQAPQQRQAQPQARQHMRPAPAAPQQRMTRPAAQPVAPAPAPVRQAPMRQAVPTAAPAPAPMRQAAPPVRQAAPAPRPANPRPSGRARGSIEREP